jgi:hypothetical protein
MTHLQPSTKSATLTEGDTPAWVQSSPWLDPKKPNLFRYEFQLARDNATDEDFKPVLIYRWIHRHGGENLFFKGLAHFAPMRPLVSYHGQVAVWLSPPPSGFGNAIYMVLGHDSTGQLRLVGGNLFTEPAGATRSPVAGTGAEFFNNFDHASSYGQQTLVMDAVRQSISVEDKPLLNSISRECEHFRTMPIYITTLTPQGSLFHAAKAVIEGDHPADFSFEFFGEAR